MLLRSGRSFSVRPPLVVIGGSAGGSQVLRGIVSALPGDFDLPILAVLHRHPSTDGSLADYLGSEAELFVQEPCDKQGIVAGCVYLAPADYHMLLGRDGVIELSVDDKVNWSRPSIDVLFESAARAYGESVIGIVLSGANADGAQGIRAIRGAGGQTVAQDPTEAEFERMPAAAIETGCVDRIMTWSGIVGYMLGLAR